MVYSVIVVMFWIDNSSVVLSADTPRVQWDWGGAVLHTVHSSGGRNSWVLQAGGLRHSPAAPQRTVPPHRGRLWHRWITL